MARHTETNRNLYEILGVSPRATVEEINAAYRDLCLVWHPDRFPGHPRLKEKAHAKFAEIARAHELLVAEASSKAPTAIVPSREKTSRSAAPGRSLPVEGRIIGLRGVGSSDPLNLVFFAFTAWWVVAFHESGGSRLALLLAPLLCALAYNLVPAARRRLRWWYLGSMAVIAASTLFVAQPSTVAPSFPSGGGDYAFPAPGGTAMPLRPPQFVGSPGPGEPTESRPLGPEAPVPPLPPESPRVAAPRR